MEKQCEFCHQHFEAKRRNRLYCSSNCRQSAYYERNGLSYSRKSQGERTSSIRQTVNIVNKQKTEELEYSGLLSGSVPESFIIRLNAFIENEVQLRLKAQLYESNQPATCMTEPIDNRTDENAVPNPSPVPLTFALREVEKVNVVKDGTNEPEGVYDLTQGLDKVKDEYVLDTPFPSEGLIPDIQLSNEIIRPVHISLPELETMQPVIDVTNGITSTEQTELSEAEFQTQLDKLDDEVNRMLPMATPIENNMSPSEDTDAIHFPVFQNADEKLAFMSELIYQMDEDELEQFGTAIRTYASYLHDYPEAMQNSSHEIVNYFHEGEKMDMTIPDRNIEEWAAYSGQNPATAKALLIQLHNFMDGLDLNAVLEMVADSKAQLENEQYEEDEEGCCEEQQTNLPLLEAPPMQNDVENSTVTEEEQRPPSEPSFAELHTFQKEIAIEASIAEGSCNGNTPFVSERENQHVEEKEPVIAINHPIVKTVSENDTSNSLETVKDNRLDNTPEPPQERRYIRLQDVLTKSKKSIDASTVSPTNEPERKPYTWMYSSFTRRIYTGVVGYDFEAWINRYGKDAEHILLQFQAVTKEMLRLSNGEIIEKKILSGLYQRFKDLITTPFYVSLPPDFPYHTVMLSLYQKMSRMMKGIEHFPHVRFQLTMECRVQLFTVLYEMNSINPVEDHKIPPYQKAS